MKSPHWEKEDFRVIIGSSRIDYDKEKEDYNRKEHKYSLLSAVDFLEHLLLPIGYRPFITRDASTTEERRHEHMTIDDAGKIVFFVTTMRKRETIRVISLRRASEKEREIFASYTGFKEKPPNLAAPVDGL
jgi:uncharacterized DUF497 family protein